MQKKRKQEQSRNKLRLTYAEQALFDSLPKVAKRGDGEYVLVAGNRSGHLPLEIKKLMPDAKLRIHAFDRYYAHAIKKRFLDSEIDTEGMILCTPQVMSEEEKDEKGIYSLAFFMSSSFAERILCWATKTSSYSWPVMRVIGTWIELGSVTSTKALMSLM